MSDVALARRVIAGEEAAFDEFFSLYFPRLYRFALTRLAGNEDAAEEIVQRVLIRAIDRLHTYKGEAALLTWLCTLCRREIGRLREQSGRDREISISDERPELRAALELVSALSSGDPDAELQRRELSRIVQLTLDHLPGRYGDALEWKYIQGLSVDEIAGRLGVGYKAAESLLTRARAAFREGFAIAQSQSSEGS
ncbi:MAG TPA: RNA polymerase sigma factor [Vicinamibacterales bacterium]|jgi:RNA polymerase sigma-70 factor (ECF subfamily)